MPTEREHAEAGPEDGHRKQASRPPGFGVLLLANARVLLVAILVMATAYGIWRGLAALFPEVSWLQA